MTVARSVLDAIGNTPLIRLNRASAATGCEILGKAEFLNPGQSVKDRAALWMVRDREAHGGPGAGLQLHDRHSADPKPGEEGRHPALWRRTGGSGRRPIRQRNELCKI